jgi:glycosyltransferase involved in cell wall biosynthesis
MKKKNIFSSDVVLALDPRGVIYSGGHDTIMRHSLYGDKFRKVNESTDTKYIILSSSEHNSKSSYDSEIFRLIRISKPTFNSYRFARLAHRIIKNNGWNVKLLIAGDPWESFWSTYIIKKLLKRKIPIQMQIHADIGDSNWRKISMMNRIRFVLVKFSIPNSDYFRVVSKAQPEFLKTNFSIHIRRIVTIPVPINTNFTRIPVKNRRPKSIGFIGRIHKDRGIWDFLNLVTVLNEFNKEFKIILIGDGPDKDLFLSKLKKSISKSRIEFLGNLPQEKMGRVWMKIGVVVSMAPVESYGRVMREALLVGVPVWATPSNGALELLRITEPGTMRIIDRSKSAIELSKEFNSLLKSEVGPNFRDKFIKENSSYAENLAKSWVSIIKNTSE